MAAELEALIRLYKQRVDDKQRALAELYRELETLETMKNNLLAELQRESDVVNKLDDIDAQTFFGPYVDGVNKKIAAIDLSLSKMEQRVNIAREDVRASFAELKKVEITAARRAEDEQREEKKKESSELDEIGLDAYRRAQESEDD